VYRADLALGDFAQQRRHQVGLGWKVAVDGSGRDLGTPGDACDLHGGHAALARDPPRSGDNRIVPGGETPGDVFGAAIGYGRPAFKNRASIISEPKFD
jgi:hypothetical protein